MSYLFIRQLLTIFLFLFSLQAQAYAKTNEQVLVVQKCLLAKNIRYEALAKEQNLLLIKVPELNEVQAARAKKPRYCSGFMNVTKAWKTYSKQKSANPRVFLQNYLPRASLGDLTRRYKIQYRTQVDPLIARIDTKQMDANLAKITSFPDRYMDSESGIEASHWIKQQVEKMVAANARHDVAVYQIKTMNAKQQSVVLKLGKDLNEPGMVIGGHMDTLKRTTFRNRPGADDNGSGVVTMLETARVLLSSGVKFKKPVYFVWYAGEEEGKLGSQSVVQYFNRKKIAVDGVLSFDMTGYGKKNDAAIGLIDDLTDTGLTTFIADLVTAYVKEPVGAVRCGYACSDHVAWYLNGNRVAYPYEAMDDTGNPYINTGGDTVDEVSVKRMADFVKLGIAFAVEMGEPVAS